MIQKLSNTNIPVDPWSPPTGFQVASANTVEKDLPSLDFELTLIEDWSQLLLRKRAWQRLAETAVEPNVFYGPDVLLPALENLVRQNVKVLIIEAPVRVCPDHRRVLCGLFPLAHKRSLRGIPFSTIEMWCHAFCYLTTPLIRRDVCKETIHAFLDWQNGQRSKLLHIPLLGGGGAIDNQLVASLIEKGRGRVVRDRHARAVLIRRESTGCVLKLGLSRKRRHEIKRSRRRLEECGDVQVEHFQPGDDPALWIEQFMMLEATGWKGRQESAIQQSVAERNFFETMVRNLADADQLMMVRLSLNGQAIAMKINLLADNSPADNTRVNNSAFCFKIAYDEQYARYSPGVLLEIENLDWLHGNQGNVTWMDSCANAGHPMIESIWPDRRNIESIVIPSGRWGAAMAAASIPMFKASKQIFSRMFNRRIRKKPTS